MGKKLTSQFFPRGKNGPARFFPGEKTDWGKIPACYTGIRLLLYPFIFFIFFSLQFSNMKMFRHTFLRNCEARKIETWFTCWHWADVSCIPESGCCYIFIPLFLHFFFLSNFPILKFIVTLFSRTVGPRRLKLGTQMDSWQIYRVYRNQAAAAYSFLYFFQFSFSPVFKH